MELRRQGGGGAPRERAASSDEMLAALAAILRGQGVEGWLVGGTVRDREFGCYSPDIDLAVAGDAAGIAREVAAALGVPWFALSHEHQAFRVVGRDGHVDVAAVRGGGILADLAQRDFTVNAMAIPLGGAALLDPFGGLGHLRERRLVAVSDRIFSEDPLRLMRAARFSHVLGLRLDPKLELAVRSQCEAVRRAAPERVASEMFLTLAAGGAGAAVRMWDGLGLLRAVLPELGEAEGNAAAALLDELEGTLADLPDRFPDAAPLLGQRLGVPVDGAAGRAAALRLAGLCRGLVTRDAQAVARRLRVSSHLASLLETSARISRYEDDAGVRGLPPVRPEDGASGSAGPGRAAVLYLWAAAPWEAEVILLAAAAAAAGGGGGDGGGGGRSGPSGTGGREGADEGLGEAGDARRAPDSFRRGDADEGVGSLAGATTGSRSARRQSGMGGRRCDHL